VPQQAEVLEIVDDKANIKEAVIASSEETGQKVVVQYVPVQEVEEKVEEAEIFDVVENMPEFPGGASALMQYLAKNIKYPTIAQENGTQGRVIVQFVVNKDGSIVDAKVARSVDPYLDKEALRVVSSMPKWKPGMQRNKPVRVKYTVPVTFRLQ
jgi:protein TonB